MSPVRWIPESKQSSHNRLRAHVWPHFWLPLNSHSSQSHQNSGSVLIRSFHFHSLGFPIQQPDSADRFFAAAAPAPPPLPSSTLLRDSSLSEWSVPFHSYSGLTVSVCFNYICHREQSISVCDKALARRFLFPISVGCRFFKNKRLKITQLRWSRASILAFPGHPSGHITALFPFVRPFPSPCCGMTKKISWMLWCVLMCNILLLLSSERN